MNFSLSPEQELVREAARGRLARADTLRAAREALDGSTLPDRWPLACEAGWPGLLSSADRGGSGLGLFEAILVAQECGRALAGVPLVGHLMACVVLEAAAAAGIEELASGERRATLVAARPPSDLVAGWTVEPASGMRREPLPHASDDGARVSGRAWWVLDAAGVDVLVVPAQRDGGELVVLVVDAGAAGVRVQPVRAYDSTRSLAEIHLDGAGAEPLSVGADALALAWYVGQAMLAAESLGAALRALEIAADYAKSRRTFGRTIGSYQAVKHALSEMLRTAENARSLLYYAGWAYQEAPDELPLAASAARSAAGRALDLAGRQVVAVHGGIGVTWEHDAQLFYRRAQLTRRLLGGTANASDQVTAELLVRAATGAG